MGKAGTFLLVRLIKVLRIKAFVDSELRSLGRLEILRLLISKIQFMEKVKMTNSPSYVKAAGRGEGNFCLGLMYTMQSARYTGSEG